MLRRTLAVLGAMGALAGGVLAQDCKMRFAVGYTDGKTLQTGLTAEQRKYWEKDGAKKYKGMCLDFAKPDYLILWAVGVSGKELAQVGVANFNRARETGEATALGGATNPGMGKGSSTDSRWVDSTLYIRASSQVRSKADYWILDLAKNPAEAIRSGQGYRELPSGLGVASGHGETVKAEDRSSTIPDETEALENALHWLKKEKKI